MKPICVKCEVFYRPTCNGRYFVEGMPLVSGMTGNTVRATWKPYKVWVGDEWTCPSCDHVVIVGVGKEPVSEHFRDDMAEWLEAVEGDPRRPYLQINDC